MASGKLNFSGTGWDIENVAGHLREKIWVEEDPHWWLTDVIQHHLKGEIRYCDPWVHSGKFHCERHGILTMIDPHKPLVHCSRIHSFIYNNFLMGMALGFYFLHYDGETSDVLFGWDDPNIWQARRFAASLLMPRQDVFDYLDQLGFNPAMLNGRNYKHIADYYLHVMAGHFQLSADPTRIRLEFLFEDYARKRDEIRSSFCTG